MALTPKSYFLKVLAALEQSLINLINNSWHPGDDILPILFSLGLLPIVLAVKLISISIYHSVYCYEHFLNRKIIFKSSEDETRNVFF